MNYFIQFLTYFRIFIAPIIFLLITIFDSYGWALFLFFLASISDYWDGFLARKYRLESKLGEIIDPIADKIIVAAALIFKLTGLSTNKLSKSKLKDLTFSKSNLSPNHLLPILARL